MLAKSATLIVALLAVAAARPTKVLDTQSAGFNTPLSWNISGNTDGSTSITDFNVINAVITGNSDAGTLKNIKNYLNALGFATECLGFHLGNPFYANLGDGQGWFGQQFELRQNIGDTILGTCLESLFGGNHLRGYQQKDTNAWFLPISEEKDVTDHHDIATNGYNKGRDAFVKAAQGDDVSYGGQCWPAAKVVYEQLYPAYAGPGDTDDDQPYDGKVAIVTVGAPSSCWF